MLSQTSDYALRAVLVIAKEYNRRNLRADEIADSTGAPRNYLAKTLNGLAKAGILTSARGPLGGFSLAIPPSTLTIARVIECFESRKPQVQCMLGGGVCNPVRPCAAHYRWLAITETRREPLANTTIAELLGDRADASCCNDAA